MKIQKPNKLIIKHVLALVYIWILITGWIRLLSVLVQSSVCKQARHRCEACCRCACYRMWSHTVTNLSSAAHTFQTKRLNAERHRCKNNIQHHPLRTGDKITVLLLSTDPMKKKTEPTSIFCAAKAWSISFLHNWSNTHCHTVGLLYILTGPSGQWLKTVHVSSCFVALSASKTIKKNEKGPNIFLSLMDQMEHRDEI